MSGFRPCILPLALFLAPALALALAACGGPRTVSHVSSLNDVFLYLPVSSLPLEVAGNPFPAASDSVVTAAAADGMSGTVNGRPLAFIPVGTASEYAAMSPHSTGYRTVLFLSGAGIVAGQALCAGALPHPDSKGGTLHVSAALCEGTEMVAWAEGWGGPVPAAPDSAFHALMNQLADAVFKRERDWDRNGPGDAWPN